jgi:hypothetical protein
MNLFDDIGVPDEWSPNKDRHSSTPDANTNRYSAIDWFILEHAPEFA